MEPGISSGWVYASAHGIVVTGKAGTQLPPCTEIETGESVVVRFDIDNWAYIDRDGRRIIV